MKRREFLVTSAVAVTGAWAWAQAGKPAAKAGGGITDKEILREGQPTTIANYCENPDKQPNKACPQFKDKPGHCDTCMFYNKDNSKTTFKGKEYARCQLLTDPKKPQFVQAKAYCATYVKQA